MYINKEIEIDGIKVLIYRDTKTGQIGIINGDGRTHIVGSDDNKQIDNEMYINKEIEIGGIKVLIYRDSKTGSVGIISGDSDTDIVGSDDNEQIENKTGDNMKHEGSFLETVLDGITDGHKDETVDGVNDSAKNEIENDNKNETGDKMEQADSEVKMNELGSLEYMYERMQQIRQGKRDGYVNKLDEALDSFEAIMLAESQLYEAVHNCKDGTDTNKSTETHNHTETDKVTDKVTDTVMPDEGKKKRWWKRGRWWKKSKT